MVTLNVKQVLLRTERISVRRPNCSSSGHLAQECLEFMVEESHSLAIPGCPATNPIIVKKNLVHAFSLLMDSGGCSSSMVI